MESKDGSMGSGLGFSLTPHGRFAGKLMHKGRSKHREGRRTPVAAGGLAPSGVAVIGSGDISHGVRELSLDCLGLVYVRCPYRCSWAPMHLHRITVAPDGRE
jgi:hypothetical protein